MEKGSAVKVASLALLSAYVGLFFYRVLDTWERSLNMNQREEVGARCTDFDLQNYISFKRRVYPAIIRFKRRRPHGCATIALV